MFVERAYMAVLEFQPPAKDEPHFCPGLGREHTGQGGKCFHCYHDAYVPGKNRAYHRAMAQFQDACGDWGLMGQVWTEGVQVERED